MASIGNTDSDRIVASTALLRAENALALAGAGFRASAILALAATIAAQPPNEMQLLPDSILTVVAVLDSGLVITTCLRTRRISHAVTTFDMVCLIALVGLSTLPAVLPGSPGQSLFYDFSVAAAVTFGLPDWSMARTLSGTLGVALMNLAPALRSGSSYQRWNALPDSATIVGISLLAAVLARLLRGSARSLDQYRLAAVARASVLAHQREQIRQQLDLRTHLMSIVEALAAGDAINDMSVSAQLQAEMIALQRLVSPEPPEPDTPVVTGLRELVTEKAAIGMHIELDHGPPIEADGTILPPLAAAALVAATREALTNVLKHSGTNRATVTVREADGGLVVGVVDRGSGYDASAATEGFGQRRSVRERINEVGGRVEIQTTPGAGTRVELWVPVMKGEAP